MPNFTYDLAQHRPDEFAKLRLTLHPIKVMHGKVALVPANLPLTGVVEFTLPEQVVSKLHTHQAELVPVFETFEEGDVFVLSHFDVIDR